MNNSFCNNCGKNGHVYNKCKKPIMSIGIILYQNTLNGVKYLNICRKDSLGYVEFIMGKYQLYNKSYINNIINEMTIQEKNKILNHDFEYLWTELWGEYRTKNQYKLEKTKSHEKYKKLKEGIHMINKQPSYSLESLIKESTTHWIEPEWGFPKGRRNYLETDIKCGLREFEEETGISRDNIELIENLWPLEEIFIGSNLKSYKHKYFLAKLKDGVNISINKYQKTEVSSIDWFDIKKCNKKIRPYNLERLQIINNVDKILNKYTLI